MRRREVPLHNRAGTHTVSTAAYGVVPRTAVQMRTDPLLRGGYSSIMSIERDDRDERQTRVERMISEFREAQTRRYMKAEDKVVESKSDANPPAPRTVTNPAH